MIHGYCTTNLDEGRRYKWPNQFVAVPREGEWVQSVDDHYYYLKVIKVTHCMVYDPNDFPSDGSARRLVPGIKVELNRIV